MAGVSFGNECRWPVLRIPLAALKPTHPWGVLLVDWIRKRADAGEVLVEGLTDR